jgi:hypothetical protein
MSFDKINTDNIKDDIDPNTDIKLKTCKIDDQLLAFVKPEVHDNKTVNNICINNLLFLDNEEINKETIYSGKGSVINYKNINELFNDFSKKIINLENQIEKLNNRVTELEGCVVYNEDETIII